MMRQTKGLGERGFSLLEVVIALGIVGLKLGILLEIQASSLANAGRARDVTIGTLLARSKMIDVEHKIFDEGLTLNDINENGDFSEEGQPQVKWKYEVKEINLDLSSLSGICGALGDDMGAQCGGMLDGLAGPLQTITDEMGRSLRYVTLTVTWPVGRYSESVTVRSLVAREDYNFAPPTPMMPNQGSVEGGGVPGMNQPGMTIPGVPGNVPIPGMGRPGMAPGVNPGLRGGGR